MQQFLKKEEWLLIIVWGLIAIVGRIIPHWPNMTAVLSMGLLPGMVFSHKRVACA